MTAADVTFVDAGGLRLRVVLDGARAKRRPLVVLHGFTGSVESMACVAEPLSRDRPVVRIELVGHGGSDAPADVAAYSMDACAAQVLAAIGELGLERPHLLGYSMGGRAALAMAVVAPDRFAGLILVGATAGIEDPELRRDRIAADEALAKRIERDGLEAFVDAWMASPLFASQARLGASVLARARAERLRNTPQGLANSLRGMGAGAQTPVFDRLDRVTSDVLLVVGEEDAKFCAIAKDLAARLPRARTEVVAGVGHAAHLEAPNAFVKRALAFLDEIDAQESVAAGKGERR